MTSPETFVDKEPNNNCMIMLMAANILIAVVAVSFAVENPDEINSSPVQSVSYQSHSDNTLLNK